MSGPDIGTNLFKSQLDTEIAYVDAMARKGLIRTSEYPYHLWARCNNREPWPIPINQAWEIFFDVHNETVKRYEFESHAFTLMINHYHWLNSTPRQNVDEGMRYFQSESSRRIARAAGRINKIWGARYNWSIIPTQNFYLRSYRYVYMNPVRAMVCEDPLQYPWSTLVKTDWKLSRPPGFSEGIPGDQKSQARWMLELRKEDDEARVRAALRRKIFAPPRVGGYK